MRRVVVLLAGVLVLAVGCGDTEGGPETMAAVSAAAPEPATSEVTGVARVTATLTGTISLPPRPHLPPVLRFGGSGIRVVDDDAVTVAFVEGVRIEMAAPDLMGGVVYQEPGAGGWRWECDEATRRVVDAGGGAMPIMRMERPGAAPEVLVPATEGRPVLVRTFRLDGHPWVMYTVMRADPDVECGPDDVEAAWHVVAHHLVLRRLDDGTTTELGVIAGFESSWVDYLIGEATMVALTETYGEGDLCGAIWPTAALLDVAGEGVWLGEGGPFWRRCDFASVVPGSALVAAVSPDGATVAYATGGAPGGGGLTLVVLDAATGREVRRWEIDGWAGRPEWLGWDGASAIVGGDEEGGPRVVLADGTVVGLFGERVAWWEETP